MKVLIIVPAFNEAGNISGVLESLYSENPEWDILVINDCSADNTVEQAMKFGNCIVINLSYNLGIGGAVQTGFKFAKLNNYDIALQFDGDGQHIASEIQKIMEPIINNEADVVIGSRFLDNENKWKTTFSRRMGIRIFEVINSILINQRIKDNTSGFRAYNKKSFEFLAESYPSDYPEPEAVIILGKNGFKIKEVPVKMKTRESGKSSIFGFLTIYYMIKVLLSIFISFIRPTESNNRIS